MYSWLQLDVRRRAHAQFEWVLPSGPKYMAFFYLGHKYDDVFAPQMD